MKRELQFCLRKVGAFLWSDAHGPRSTTSVRDGDKEDEDEESDKREEDVDGGKGGSRGSQAQADAGEGACEDRGD